MQCVNENSDHDDTLTSFSQKRDGGGRKSNNKIADSGWSGKSIQLESAIFTASLILLYPLLPKYRGHK